MRCKRMTQRMTGGRFLDRGGSNGLADAALHRILSRDPSYPWRREQRVVAGRDQRPSLGGAKLQAGVDRCRREGPQPAMAAGQLAQHGTDFSTGQHDRHALRALGAHDLVEPGQFDLQYLTCKGKAGPPAPGSGPPPRRCDRTPSASETPRSPDHPWSVDYGNRGSECNA